MLETLKPTCSSLIYGQVSAEESDGMLHDFTDGRMWQNSTLNLDSHMYVIIHLYNGESELYNCTSTWK